MANSTGSNSKSRAVVAKEILEIARSHQCSAQVTMAESLSKDISLRNGQIEHLLTSTAISTGVRLFKDKRSTIIAFSGEDFGNMKAKLETALENLQYLSQDSFKRLLTAQEFGDAPAELDLSDGKFDSLDIPHVVDALKQIENRALAFSNKITPADMAEFSGISTNFHLFTSEGVDKSFDKTLYTFSYTAVAQENGQKERDYWYEKNRYFSQLPPMEEIGMIGEKAAERAIKRLGGKKIPSGERKTVFSYRTAGSLLSLLSDALDGEEIVVKNSFLLDRLGQTLFPEKVTIIDDPLLDRYPGSYPFDGEGMNSKTKAVVEKGKIVSYLHNSYSAGKLGMELTGNASRSISSEPHIMVGNFYLQSGQASLDDLLLEMKEGLLVDELYVSGMNAVTGDFSFGCSGFLVEKGKITAPVREITIAGNLLELFKNILEIGNDNRWQSSLTSPSILVSKLSVGGS
jgi:PmbA protein